MSQFTRQTSIPVDAPATPHIEFRTKLSDREVEVLSLISEGLSNKEAGIALGISKRTVDFSLTEHL